PDVQFFLAPCISPCIVSRIKDLSNRALAAVRRSGDIGGNVSSESPKKVWSSCAPRRRCAKRCGRLSLSSTWGHEQQTQIVRTPPGGHASGAEGRTHLCGGIPGRPGRDVRRPPGGKGKIHRRRNVLDRYDPSRPRLFVHCTKAKSFYVSR